MLKKICQIHWYILYCDFTTPWNVIVSVNLWFLWTAARILEDRAAGFKPHSRCMLGLYVKPTWRRFAFERCVRSAGACSSFQAPGGPASSHTLRGTSPAMGSGGHTAASGPLCRREGVGSWDAPFCWAEVWVSIRLSGSASIRTWPKTSPRWARAARRKRTPTLTHVLGF